ncbi:hypothetical protein KEM55_007354 [Ascosphaera atra]|nr:hypothetical protein KEM55_007354 [Ascosphaera atra]
MNWTCVCYGGPMLFCLIWFAVDARKWFKGPKINVDNQHFDGQNIVIDGLEGAEQTTAVVDPSEKKVAEDQKGFGQQ